MFKLTKKKKQITKLTQQQHLSSLQHNAKVVSKRKIFPIEKIQRAL